MALAAGLMLGCALLAGPVAAQDFKVLGANLMGKGFEGGGAAEDASGDFDGEIDLTTNRLCYYLSFDGIDGADAAEIRKGKGADADPKALDLPLPATPGDEACADAAPDVLKAIAARPGDYYVAVHTSGLSEPALKGRFKG